MLRRLCARRESDAQDLFQDTASRIWRTFSSRPRLRSPRAWLMTIGYHVFVDAESRRPQAHALEDPPDHSAAEPSTLAEHNELVAHVQASIRTLPEPVRQVVILHYMGGLSLRQTASAMGISTGTAKSRLSTALVQLRRVLT